MDIGINRYRVYQGGGDAGGIQELDKKENTGGISNIYIYIYIYIHAGPQGGAYY